ncbi:MAG: NADH-quinone oxidoreductase subunit J [Desulfurivibrionaceae bacterium]|nr:NADH-quinone oxidoreductase subunit J [Desulfobulbales bacterium]MDT8334521.1 NADH-quinone oxidoreductase subunit J [Desulfurivibrionaceae bacterium]
MISLFTAEGLAGLVFLFIVAVTIGGALIAVNSIRLPRAITGLAISFVGVAGLYYFLNSPFVAVMEMLIYVGAVCVTIVFAIMLADPGDEQRVGRRSAIGAPVAFGVGALLFWGLALLGINTMWPAAAARVSDGSVKDIGHSLVTTYGMVFELISLVLLLAIIGSLVLARAGRSKS